MGIVLSLECNAKRSYILNVEKSFKINFEIISGTKHFLSLYLTLK